MNLLSNLWTLLGLAGAALGGLVLAYLRGRSAGAQKAENKQLKDTLDKVREINDARSDNASLSVEQLRDKLRDAQR